jgi:hypothetical protein
VARAARRAGLGAGGRLARRIGARLGVPVALAFTDNTHTMVRFSPRRAGWVLRLHVMFAGAPDEVVDALGAWLARADRYASARLDAFIHERRALVRRRGAEARRAGLRLVAEGRAHHLAERLGEVLSELEAGERRGCAGVAIGWAPAPRVRLPRRSIRLGSYAAETAVVRVHRALDQAWVPAFFVRWVVRHELIHHLLRAELGARRGCLHSPAFRQLERAHPEFEAGRAFERAHLDRLLAWHPGDGPRTAYDLPRLSHGEEAGRWAGRWAGKRSQSAS